MDRLEELRTMTMNEAMAHLHMKKTTFYDLLGKGKINPHKTIIENGKRTIFVSEVIRLKELQIEKSSF